MTKAGLYYYIQGKGDLLFRIMEVAMITIEKEVICVARQCQTAEHRLATVVRRHAALVTQQGSAPFAILVDELSGLAPEARSLISDRQRGYVQFIRSTLEELRAEGRLRPEIDPLAAAFALLGMVLWTSRWYRPDGELTSEDLANQLASMVLNGVLLPAT